MHIRGFNHHHMSVFSSNRAPELQIHMSNSLHCICTLGWLLTQKQYIHTTVTFPTQICPFSCVTLPNQCNHYHLSRWEIIFCSCYTSFPPSHTDITSIVKFWQQFCILVSRCFSLSSMLLLLSAYHPKLYYFKTHLIGPFLPVLFPSYSFSFLQPACSSYYINLITSLLCLNYLRAPFLNSGVSLQQLQHSGYLQSFTP